MARENKSNRDLRRQMQRMQQGTIDPSSLAQDQLRVIQHQEITHQVTFGPLPEPEVLARFDSVKPGFAERIVAMAETEGAHRRALEVKVIDSQIDDRKAHRTEARIGQFCALIISLAFLSAGTYAITHDSQIAAAIFGGTSMVFLVS